MKRLLYLSLVGATVTLIGCGQDDLTTANAPYVKPPVITPFVQQPKKEPVRYAYHGDRYRDPFIGITGEGPATFASDDIPVPSLGALTLKGIIDDGRQATAIIAGGGITYVLKGRRLYDNRQRLVKGITGIIKEDSVLMIGADKSTKELKLREKP